jgi:DNA-binding IclR family transcriptional regulator
MAPPGPNGTTPRELALRADRDELTVQRLLGDLSELGYVERDAPAGGGEPRVWLTAEGFAMAHIAERVVLAKFAEEAAPAGAPPARAGG